MMFFQTGWQRAHVVASFLTLLVLPAMIQGAADGQVVKQVIDVKSGGKNLLTHDAWRPWSKGFQREGKYLVCDNSLVSDVQRGASQTVSLQQTAPDPIIATAWSRSLDVTGAPDSNYSLYLDLTYMDGDHLWGQTAPFDTGTHSWQEQRVIILPEKPVATVTVNLLLRGHAGKVWFRDAALRLQRTPAGATRFDGVPIKLTGRAHHGFQVRDVAANSNYVAITENALGLRMTTKTKQNDGATFYDITLHDTTGKDRALTLVYTVPVAPTDLSWLDNPRHSTPIGGTNEYANTVRFRAGSNGLLSQYPFGAVANRVTGTGLGIDMAQPAFYRVGYNAATGELFLAYDIGLAPENPTTNVRFCHFTFDPKWHFRAALARYYQLFPEAFQCRTPKQGLWMPFAKISRVERWQDFGFQFKEGNDETEWDDAHGITTFRYTEPMTWWMRMPKAMPRTMDQAIQYAKQLAEQKNNDAAKSLINSGFHDEQGRLVALLRDTPWCDGAVWSVNSMPRIAGEPTDFKLKWNPEIRARYYGPQRHGDLDGEYIDSSEGYVTAQLDFRRDHFPAVTTPLCYSRDSRQPAIFRALIAFEYIRAISQDVHHMDRLMMANSTPSRICWLAPLLDVLGTEMDWHPNGKWRPMSDTDMLYRRAMCKGKPYCFLMNTRFEQFPHALVEKYMKRAVAYGMFPGFFSHNASQGHYFTRPELYNRDRSLFMKYVPLCRQLAEAGWQPISQATCSDSHIHIERFGERYLTVLNDSSERRTAEVLLEPPFTATDCRELIMNQSMECQDNRVSLVLDPGDVAVLDFK